MNLVYRCHWTVRLLRVKGAEIVTVCLHRIKTSELTRRPPSRKSREVYRSRAATEACRVVT